MRLVFGLMSVALVGCAPTVSIRVLEPAAVTFPSDVMRVAVVDRSAAGNAGEHVLSAIEGALTGEAIHADREGAIKAMEAAIQTVEDSPRFDAVVPVVDLDEVESGIWDDTITWKAADRICRRVDAQALVALESFDSDSSIAVTVAQVTETKDGQDVTRNEYTARRETSVLTSWRVYDVLRHELIDQSREFRYADSWEQKGKTEAEAVGLLPSQYDTIMTVGWIAGEDYGRRISPSYNYLYRPYYGAKDPRLKAAKVHVRALDWEGAAKEWRAMVDDPNPKMRGRAKYNLAVYLETQGKLEAALDRAQQASIDLNNGRSRWYVRELSQRIADQRLLDEQMKVTEPDQPDRPRNPPVVVGGEPDQPAVKGGTAEVKIESGASTNPPPKEEEPKPKVEQKPRP